MAAVALIKFTQGPNTDVAGKAVKGTLTDGAVTIENDDNTDVVEWRIYLLDAPPDSAVFPIGSQPQILATAISGTPLHNMTQPDTPGTYRIMLEVEDAGGAVDRDIRCFGVPDDRGFIPPPYQKNPDPLPLLDPPVIITETPRPEKPDEQNYGTNPVGWAGDLTSGQMRTFFANYTDLPPTTVTSTPYTITSPFRPAYIVDLPTISGNAQINLPLSPRTGLTIRVAALGPQSASQVLTVAPQGGGTVGSLALVKMLGDTSAYLTHKGSNNWQMLGGKHHFDEKTLVGSLVSEDSSPGWTVVGGTVIDPDQYPNATITLSVIAQTTNAADAAEFRLFDVTDVAVVAGSTLSWTEVDATLKTASITLASGSHVYEAQIRLATTGAPNRAICSHAQLGVDWFQP